MMRLCLLLIALCCSTVASAHKPSDSYLTLVVDGTQLHGRWDIALRDLDVPLVLDADGDGKLTWGEVRPRTADISAYAFSHLRLQHGDCPLKPQGMQIDHHSDGAYAVLRFDAQCAAAPKQLSIDYHLFADLDTLHKGLVQVIDEGAIATAILGVDHPQETLDIHGKPAWAIASDFIAAGFTHIWLGFDHALFLLALLLPAAYKAQGRRWQAVASLRPVALELLRIVTAFTAAHAITLTLASLRWVSVPSAVVETGIAVTILLAALNNLYPLVQQRLWLLAFGFGLIHGFGFAGVLADMALPRWHMVIALGAFNLGVEAGQAALVLLLLPVLYLYRHEVWFKRVVLYGGSLVVALFACGWAWQRAAQIGAIT